MAVLKFLPRKEDPEHAWLSAGLSHLVSGDLARRPGVVVVAREEVDHLLKELALAEKGVFGTAEAMRVARVADADWAVLGTWAVSGKTLDVELTIVDAKSGKTLRTGKETGDLASLAGLVSRLANAVFSGGGLVDVTPIPPVPVEAFAAYSEALAAEQEGDYPRAFVGYARALRSDPSFVRAALDLGRLYAQTGEPGHAVVEWRRIACEALDPDAAYEAAFLAAGELERSLGRPGEAAALMGETRVRFPQHREAGYAALHAAELAAAAGEWVTALRLLREEEESTSRRLRPIEEARASAPPGSRGYAQGNRSVYLAQAVAGTLGAITTLRQSVSIRAALAGVDFGSPPADVVRVDAARPTVPLPSDPPERPGTTYPMYDAGLVLVAPPGMAIASVTLDLDGRGGGPMPWQADPVVRRGGGRVTWSADPWGRWDVFAQRNLEVGPEVTSLHDVRTLDLPVRACSVGVHLAPGRISSGSLTCELAPAVRPEEEHPPRPAGAQVVVAGLRPWIGDPRLLPDRKGHVHLVHSDVTRELLLLPGQTYGSLDRSAGDADLWLASSTDDGRTFGPARRLAVSSDAGDVSPALVEGKDGAFRLVWVSNRSERTRPGLWQSESRDLVHWTYPRRVPLRGLADVTRIACPRALVDGLGKVHVFVMVGAGASGSGYYEVVSSDGVEWSEPRLVAAGDVMGIRGWATRVGPESFVCAIAGTGPVTRLLRSDAAGPWVETLTAPDAGAARSGALWVPRIAVAPSGDLLLLDAMERNEMGLFRSRDGRAFTGPEARLPDPSDLLVLPDGTLLVPFVEWGLSPKILVWRREPAK